MYKSQSKNKFSKCYTPNWSEEVLQLKKLKIQHCGHMQQEIIIKITETFHKQELQKTKQALFKIEKVLEKRQ